MGAMHPFLFFGLVYIIALAMSVFICSSLFYSCQARQTKMENSLTKLQP